ncbi:O-acetylhomoserine aminocarboxypropyltransferase/cysteine synthase family protein [Frondihabitans cladoniiphilus]
MSEHPAPVPEQPAPEALDFATRQIHAGAVVDSQTKARVTPIYQTAGYVFDDFDDGEDRFAGRSGFRAYSRNENPTNAVAGQRLADLEGGVDGIVVSSGQAAIAVALFALAETGDHILATSSLYEGTRDMFKGSLRRQGLTIEYVPDDATDEEWTARITDRTKAIYTETIPNPLNQVADLERLARIAHAAGIPLVVDSTVATPYLCRPIEWGADIVIHSTSKWLAGHGSVIGGAIVDGGRFDWKASGRFPQLSEGPTSFVDRFGAGAYLAYLRSVVVLEYGPTVAANSTFLLLHGIETLSVRLAQQVANSQEVAEALSIRPEVKAVLYPGLPSDPFHERAKKYLPNGAGAVVTIDLAGGREAARRFIDALRLVSPMTHIGDVRSMAIHLGSTIHAKLTDEEKLAAGITPGLVRLSIGLESARDILADLDRGLLAAGVPTA